MKIDSAANLFWCVAHGWVGEADCDEIASEWAHYGTARDGFSCGLRVDGPFEVEIPATVIKRVAAA